MFEIKQEIKSEPSENETDEENVDRNGEDNDSNKDAESEQPNWLKQMLKMKVILCDGSEVHLFSFGPPDGDTHQRHLNCHLCRMEMYNRKKRKGHLTSQWHKRNVNRLKAIDSSRYNKPFNQYYGPTDEGNRMFFTIMPGENIEEVTEEYEDRIIIREFKYPQAKTTHYLALKDEKIHEYNENFPMLGLDYLFKMRAKDKTVYYCTLCARSLKQNAFMHVASSSHQAAYIIKHFPTLYARVTEGLKGIKNELAAEQRIRNIFRYLYQKIECSLGRNKIKIVDYDNFQKHLKNITQMSLEEPHYNENSIEISLEEVDAMIKKALKGDAIFKTDLINIEKPELGVRSLLPIDLDYIPRKEKDEPPQKKRRQDSAKSRPPRNNEAYSRMPGNEVDDLDSKYKMYESNPKSHPQRRQDSTKPRPSGNNEAYSRMPGNEIDDLDSKYRMFESNAKSHPQYDIEWQRFCRERSQQLIKDNIDPRYHDFKAEWPAYWLNRLCQLYEGDLASLRLQPTQWQAQAQPQSQMQSHPQPQMQSHPQPPCAPPINQDHRMPIFTEETSILSSEPLSIISVIRLLSAFEDLLGSLGPKAVDLLSKAVLYEKDKGSADELLLDKDCYVLLATIKEKLRGLLQAKVIGSEKIKSVSHCINEISAILQIMARAQVTECENERKEAEKLQQQKKQNAEKILNLINEYEFFKETCLDACGSNGNNHPAYGDAGNSRNRNATETMTSAASYSHMNSGQNSWAAGSNSGRSDNLRQNFTDGNVNFSRSLRDGNDISRGNLDSRDNIDKVFGSNYTKFSGGLDNSRNLSGGNSARDFDGRRLNDNRNNSSGRSNSGHIFGPGNIGTRNDGGNLTVGKSFPSNDKSDRDRSDRDRSDRSRSDRSRSDRRTRFGPSLNNMSGSSGRSDDLNRSGRGGYEENSRKNVGGSDSFKSSGSNCDRNAAGDSNNLVAPPPPRLNLGRNSSFDRKSVSSRKY